MHRILTTPLLLFQRKTFLKIFMAFPGISWRFLATQSASIRRSRCLLPFMHSPILSSPFSSLDEQSDTSNNQYRIRNQCDVDERSVLNELSDLLPVLRSSSVTNLNKQQNLENRIEIIRAVDGFLLPEEKLRGVFLQKLRGKTAIEQALTDVGVDLNVEIIGKVVNRGNLDGEKMVYFSIGRLNSQGFQKILILIM